MTYRQSIDPWARPPHVVVLDYGGVLATGGRSPILNAAVDVVVALARHGTKLILASNTAVDQPIGVRTEQLRAVGVDWCFDVVIESEQLGCAKPDPQFFQCVLGEIRRLAPRAETFDTVWVEDSDRRGIVPAIQYGLRAVWISQEQDARLTAVQTVRHIPDIAELPAALGISPLPNLASAAQHSPIAATDRSLSHDTTGREDLLTFPSRLSGGLR